MKALIFDMDGVIIDSEKVYEQQISNGLRTTALRRTESRCASAWAARTM